CAPQILEKRRRQAAGDRSGLLDAVVNPRIGAPWSAPASRRNEPNASPSGEQAPPMRTSEPCALATRARRVAVAFRDRRPRRPSLPEATGEHVVARTAVTALLERRRALRGRYLGRHRCVGGERATIGRRVAVLDDDSAIGHPGCRPSDLL